MTYIPENAIDKGNLILDLIARRQQALGANLANVNTPGYVRQDVSFEQYLGALQSPLETKLSKMLGPSPLMKRQAGQSQRLLNWLRFRKYALVYCRYKTRNYYNSGIKTAAQVGK